MKQTAKRRVKLNPKAPIAIVFLMILIVIGIIAVMFCFFINDDLNRIDTLNLPSSQDNKSNVNSSDDNTTSDENTSGDASASDASEPITSEITPPAPPEPLKTIVPESEAVDRTYFDDAIFIGDSISKGLKVYGVLPPGNVIADQNVGIPTIANNKPAYTSTSNKKITLYEAIKAVPVKPKKIYIMLGLNGLPHYTNEDHIPYYYTVLDEIMKQYPDATIYVQSVTPITAQAEKNYAAKKQIFTNKKINEFNELVKKMCEDKKVFYLSVRDVLTDANGYLKADYAAPDGVHFIKVGHEAMYKYFKTHTVPVVLDNNLE